MRSYLLALAVVPTLVATTVARADNTVRLDAEDIATTDPTLPLEPITAPLNAPANTGDVGPKNPHTAQALAVLGTVAGPAIMYAGLQTDGPGPNGRLTVPLLVAGAATSVLGPSLGNWYAGEGLSKGLGVRLAGTAVIGVGASVFFSGLFSSESQADTGAMIALAGLATVGVGAVMDIAHAPNAARGYNRAHAARSLAITPTASTASGEHRTGLAVVGTF